MANRYTTQFVSAFEKKLIIVRGRVNFGASGAPTLVAAASKGIISCTRNGTGEYTFVFGSTGQANLLDIYVRLLGGSVLFQTSSTTIPAAPLMNIVANNTGTLNTSSLQIQLYAAGGSAADPASGEIGRFEFEFGDSTAP